MCCSWAVIFLHSLACLIRCDQECRILPPHSPPPAKDPINHIVLLTALADMMHTHPEDNVLSWLADQLLLTPEDLQRRVQFRSNLQVRTPATCSVQFYSNLPCQYNTIVGLTSRLLYVCCSPSVAYLEIRQGGGQASTGRQFPTRGRPQSLKRLRQMMTFFSRRRPKFLMTGVLWGEIVPVS